MKKRGWTIVQVPYGGGFRSLNIAKPKGARNAPVALLKEFRRQRIFMADNGFSSWDDIPCREIDLGFGLKNNEYDWAKIHKNIFSSNLIADPNKNFLFLGGSHTITASTYSAIARMHGFKQTGLIVLDAHPDCCHKADWPIHSDWLRWLIEDGYVLPKNILIIGLRQIEKYEKKFLSERDILYYKVNSIKHIDFPMVFGMRKLNELAAIYLSIDIDVASGAYAPGTGCPSPGGFTDLELIALVKQIKNALPNFRAADIVEINPLKWWQKYILRYDITVDLGVKLMKEIVS